MVIIGGFLKAIGLIYTIGFVDLLIDLARHNDGEYDLQANLITAAAWPLITYEAIQDAFDDAEEFLDEDLDSLPGDLIVPAAWLPRED